MDTIEQRVNLIQISNNIIMSVSVWKMISHFYIFYALLVYSLTIWTVKISTTDCSIRM